MAVDRLQLQRLELKYLISERKALAVREFVRCYLDVDEYGANSEDFSYDIHSLYLDSDDLKTYWDTINGNKNRYKLRIRYYDERSDSPVFFEIKRRMNDAILKQRAGARREAAAEILEGYLPDPSMLISDQPKYWVGVQRFCHLMVDIQAKPKGHIAYRREAWVTTHDNSVRVTMDRQVRFEPRFKASFSTQMKNPVYPFHPYVILELKFTGRYPNWLGELVRAFNLQRASASKYCDGIAAVGEDYFYRRAAFAGNGRTSISAEPPPPRRIGLKRPRWRMAAVEAAD